MVEEEDEDADTFNKKEKDLIVAFFSNNNLMITVDNIINQLFTTHKNIKKRFLAYHRKRFSDRDLNMWYNMFSRMIRQWAKSRD